MELPGFPIEVGKTKKGGSDGPRERSIQDIFIFLTASRTDAHP
jgi:hypothetical protein